MVDPRKDVNLDLKMAPLYRPETLETTTPKADLPEIGEYSREGSTSHINRKGSKTWCRTNIAYDKDGKYMTKEDFNLAEKHRLSQASVNPLSVGGITMQTPLTSTPATYRLKGPLSDAAGEELRKTPLTSQQRSQEVKTPNFSNQRSATRGKVLPFSRAKDPKDSEDNLRGLTGSPPLTPILPVARVEDTRDSEGNLRGLTVSSPPTVETDQMDSSLQEPGSLALDLTIPRKVDGEEVQMEEDWELIEAGRMRQAREEALEAEKLEADELAKSLKATKDTARSFSNVLLGTLATYGHIPAAPKLNRPPTGKKSKGKDGKPGQYPVKWYDTSKISSIQKREPGRTVAERRPELEVLHKKSQDRKKFVPKDVKQTYKSKGKKIGQKRQFYLDEAKRKNEAYIAGGANRDIRYKSSEETMQPIPVEAPKDISGNTGGLSGSPTGEVLVTQPLRGSPEPMSRVPASVITEIDSEESENEEPKTRDQSTMTPIQGVFGPLTTRITTSPTRTAEPDDPFLEGRFVDPTRISDDMLAGIPVDPSLDPERQDCGPEQVTLTVNLFFDSKGILRIRGSHNLVRLEDYNYPNHGRSPIDTLIDVYDYFGQYLHGKAHSGEQVPLYDAWEHGGQIRVVGCSNRTWSQRHRSLQTKSIGPIAPKTNRLEQQTSHLPSMTNPTWRASGLTWDRQMKPGPCLSITRGIQRAFDVAILDPSDAVVDACEKLNQEIADKTAQELVASQARYTQAVETAITSTFVPAQSESPQVEGPDVVMTEPVVVLSSQKPVETQWEDINAVQSTSAGPVDPITGMTQKEEELILLSDSEDQ